MDTLYLVNDIDFGVINNNLLINSVLQQCPTGDIKRLLSQDGVQLGLVNVLRIDFLKIMKIEHLWMLKSLTVLTIAHNKISKIENLDELVNLKQLDLSFNKIAKIENINALTNIEILMLNNNEIELLENMENLQRLTVLSVSGNLIEDFNQFRYLRQFNRLKSLSLKENPCCNSLDNDFIKAILPQLMFLNYIMVSTIEKEESTKKYSNLIKQLNEMDELAEKIEKQKQIEESFAELNFKSFVEQLDGPELFEGMFEYDKDGFILLNVKDDLETAFNVYKDVYLKLMKTFVEFGHSQYKVRDDEIKTFQNVIQEARRICMEKSREKIQNFLIEKEKLSIEKNQSNSNNFHNLNMNLWKTLMTDEVTLHEKSMETMNKFEENIKILVNDMIVQSQDVFNIWRDKEQEWINVEKSFFNRVLQEEIEIQAPEIKYLLTDGDILMDIIKLSLDNHIQFINDREELLITRIKKWLYDTLHEIKWDELNRNRSKILEMVNFRNNEKSDWEKNHE